MSKKSTNIFINNFYNLNNPKNKNECQNKSKDFCQDMTKKLVLKKNKKAFKTHAKNHTIKLKNEKNKIYKYV